jgi:hypothetical protein
MLSWVRVEGRVGDQPEVGGPDGVDDAQAPEADSPHGGVVASGVVQGQLERGLGPGLEEFEDVELQSVPVVIAIACPGTQQGGQGIRATGAGQDVGDLVPCEAIVRGHVTGESLLELRAQERGSRCPQCLRQRLEPTAGAGPALGTRGESRVQLAQRVFQRRPLRRRVLCGISPAVHSAIGRYPRASVTMCSAET